MAALQDELAANQQRIAAARAYQTEQGKRYSDRQISSQVLAKRIGGSEELITQAERDGAAICIQLVRTDSAERLVAAENDHVCQSDKEKISEAGLADIQGQYAARRADIFRKEAVAIEKFQADLRDKLAVQPLEFKVPKLDESKYFEDLGRKNLLTYQRRAQDIQAGQSAADDVNLQSLVLGEITQKEYLKRRRENRRTAD
ncbi:MAG: hypothetical protein ACRYFK_12215 [Janthinobacterium lividum]